MNTYEQCCSIRRIILNCTAEVMNYKSWGEEYAYKRIMELPQIIKVKNINPSELSMTEMKDLGFGRWNEETELMLIPLWLMQFIDPEIDVICIDGDTVKFKDADNDNRYGCLAFGVIPKK